jgi:signal transduction histidine kinase
MSNLRVLVVEDDYLVSEMVCGTLEEIGHTVVGEASTGPEAIAFNKTLRPDLVVLDIHIPELDGIEVARQIQMSCPTPVIILTAYESESLVKKASEAGVGAYLVKPPNGAEMRRAITVATARFADIMELRRLNDTLQRRNEELDAFAHTVAHDLQNLLARMIGFAEMLFPSFRDMPAEEVETYLDFIIKNGRKMSEVIDELLLLAGVRQLEVTLVPVDMAPIVAAVQQRLADEIEDSEVELTMPETWPLAWGYGPWLEEVWLNYMSNAIRYGGRPLRVKLGAAPAAEDMVAFWVADNGPGIDLNEQEHLFQPFSKLDQITSEGHGLGLSIVRRIIEKLGGNVGVDSAPGRGSRFWFTLAAAGSDNA